VPALMGAIMSVGVATANSILMVTFANDYMGGLEGPPKPANDYMGGLEGPPKPPVGGSETARGTRAAPRDRDSRAAALAAGATRLRPVLMTALAMIIGMLPMSLGLGEGGEQNAPLGRAVIGGLSVATFATLFLVPIIYSILRRRPPREDVLTEQESSHA